MKSLSIPKVFSANAVEQSQLVPWHLLLYFKIKHLAFSFSFCERHNEGPPEYVYILMTRNCDYVASGKGGLRLRAGNAGPRQLASR